MQNMQNKNAKYDAAASAQKHAKNLENHDMQNICKKKCTKYAKLE